MRIVYDEKHVTKEESPLHLSGFIKQRTRWNQGFMQVFLKGEWLSLPKFSQILLSGYILSSPELQALMFLYMPLSLAILLLIKLPVWLTLLSSLPFYILFWQLVTYCVGLSLFTRDYHVPYPLWMPMKIFLTFYPYQLILGFSAARAVMRMMSKNNAWEKTHHANVHRIPSPALQLAV
jgi:glycosyltransferase XagB